MKMILAVVLCVIAIASANPIGWTSGLGYNGWSNNIWNNGYGGYGWGHGGGWNGPIAQVVLTPDAQYLRDTPEVAHAKAAHAVAHASASRRDWRVNGWNNGWGHDSGNYYGYGGYANGYPHQW